MKSMSFIVTFGSFVLTTALLYLVGYVFIIPLLMFHHEYIDTATGSSITTGSLVPLIIGLFVIFFAEKIYNHKNREKIGL